jgi:transposase-like protein
MIRRFAYPEELRVEVVEAVEWGGERASDVARRRGLRPGTVRQWVKRHRDRMGRRAL